MSMRKLLACTVAAMSLNPLAAAVAQASERCEVGQGCGLQGPRGAMEDESLLQRRPFTPGGLPALPHNAERELPREKLILWQYEGALGEREHLLDVGEETIDTVALRDGLPVVRFASGRSAVPDTDSDALARLMQRLADERIALTVCPLSNQKLCVFPDLADHKLLQLLEAGLAVTVNSDDPAYFGGYLNDNFTQLFAAVPALNARHAYQLAFNSLEASFVAQADKNAWQHQLKACFERFADHQG